MLTCDLIEASINDSLDYEALSYTWTEINENAPERTGFRCDGSYISITVHLASALFQIRHGSQSRNLWIDQVCIDQGNASEKDCQIPLMGQIYSKATTVLIWLGSGDHDSELAMAITPGLIRDLEGLDQSSELNQCSALDESSGLGQRIESRFQVLGANGELGAYHANALNRLLKRRWFSRVWTLQEAALGLFCQLLCGDRRIDFDLLLLLNDRSRTDSRGHWKAAVNEVGMANFLENINQRYAMQHLQTISKLKEASAQRASCVKEPLYMLLARLRTCGCTDDKDRIYGLFEFLPVSVQQSLVNGLKPSEHTVESLYVSLAVTEIVNRKQITFLSIAGLAEQGSKLQLPSWVPDWTYVGEQRSRSFAVFNQDRVNKGNEPIYQAGNYSHNLNPKVDGDILHVQGKFLGLIVDIGVRFSFALPSKMDFPTRIEKYAKNARLLSQELDQVNASVALSRHHKPLYTGTDTDMACYRTIFTCGKVLAGRPTLDTLLLASDSELQQHMESLAEERDLSLKWSMEPNNEALTRRRIADFRASGFPSFKEYLARLEQIRSQAGKAIETFQDACKGRAYCIMEQTLSIGHGEIIEKRKFVGLAPRNAEVGNVVAVVYGCPAPMLLRRIENTSDDGNGRTNDEPKYRLLSECFIHGFMNGEAIEMTQLNDQDIALV